MQVPAEYMRWVKKTQDDAPSEFREGEWREIVEENLGKSLDEVNNKSLSRLGIRSQHLQYNTIQYNTIQYKLYFVLG